MIHILLKEGSGIKPGTVQVAMLPNLGKLQPAKSARDTRCRSPLAAAM
jgi:hypothetical protein